MSNPENTQQNPSPNSAGNAPPPKTPQFDLSGVPPQTQSAPESAPLPQALNPSEEEGGDHGFGTIPLDILNNSSRRAATPSYEAPPPVNLPPGARLSLTGEIIEADTPSSPSAGHMGQSASLQPPMGRPQPPMPGMNPQQQQQPARPTQFQNRPQPQAAEAKGAGGVIGLVAGLALLVALALGGWYWYVHRTNPKDQAKLVYLAALKQDWKTVYPLCAFSEEGKKAFPSADAFETATKEAYNKLSENPLYSQAISQLNTAADTATIGEPEANGEQTNVPTSLKLSLLGQTLTLKGKARMVNDGGTWKLNVIGASSADVGQAFMNLVGSPDMSAFKGQ